MATDKNIKKAFEEMMMILQDVYGNPNAPLTEIRMNFYWQVLSCMSIDDMNVAMKNIARTRTIHTIPTPAEILQAAMGDHEQDAYIAFERMLSIAKKYRSTRFDNDTIPNDVKAIADLMGGFGSIADWETKDRDRHRKEFVALYQKVRGGGHTGRPMLEKNCEVEK